MSTVKTTRALVSEDDLRDFASSACQEAFSFGVNEDAFMRLARSVEQRARCEMVRMAAQPVAWRGLNSLGEVVTEWIDGAPPETSVDLCGNPASFSTIELAYPCADVFKVERALDDAHKNAVLLGDVVEKNDSLKAKLAELVSAVRSINFGPRHELRINDDGDPQYPQRKEWCEWLLGLCDEAMAASSGAGSASNLNKLRNESKLRNLHNHAVVPDYAQAGLLRSGTLTTESGGGKYTIKLTYKSLADRRLAESELRALLAVHGDQVLADAIDVQERLSRLIDQIKHASPKGPAFQAQPSTASVKH